MPNIFDSFTYSLDGTTITGFNGVPNDNDIVVFIDKPGSPNKVTTVNIQSDLSSSVSGLTLDFKSLSSLTQITNVTNGRSNLGSAISSVDLSYTENLRLKFFSFYDSSGLQYVNMSHSNNLYCDNGIFVNCFNLNTINMSHSTNLTIGNENFKFCDSLQTVDASFSTNLVIYYGFKDCTNLQNVFFRNCNGLILTDSIFENCTSLRTLDMTSCTALTMDGRAMFNNCSVIDVYLPFQISLLNTKAFLWRNAGIYSAPPSSCKYYLNTTEKDVLNITTTNLTSIDNLPNDVTYSSGVISGTVTNFGTFPVTFNVDDPIPVIIYFVNTMSCFLEGSQILISQEPKIYKAIEELVEGDTVISCFTLTPVKIRRCVNRKVKLQQLEPTNIPYVIPKDFFGVNTPDADVYISGHHRVICNLNNQSKLGIHAYNIDGIKPAIIPETELYYYHIELDCDETNGVICSNISVEALEHL